MLGCLVLHVCKSASCSHNRLRQKMATARAAATRVSIVICLQACYVVASKARELFEEMTSRHKDYIARPKENGYQSLHCTVKLPPVTVECEGWHSAGQDDAALEECLLNEGPTCELQIRTQSKLLSQPLQEPMPVAPCLNQQTKQVTTGIFINPSVTAVVSTRVHANSQKQLLAY